MKKYIFYITTIIHLFNFLNFKIINTSFSGHPPTQSECVGRSIFIPRSQGANTARELVSWQNQIHNSKFVYSGSFGFSRSYNALELSQYIFGNDIINFSGSQVADRDSLDWVADYFGLPTDFSGTIQVKPTIANIIIDTQLFIPLDCIYYGLYLELHAPINNTRWQIQYSTLKSCSGNTSTQNEFPAGYMQNTSTDTYSKLKQALFSQQGFGDTQKRAYGNFTPETLTQTKIADIDIMLGYDFINNSCNNDYSDGKFSLFLQAVMPTGNKPDPKYIFTPISGNGKHFEFGAGLFAKLPIWNDDCNRHLNLFFQGNITHMFSCKQQRSFDLCQNGTFSRYMLLKEFDETGTIYSGVNLPAINYTTRHVNVSVPVKGDLSIKLSYKSRHLDMDLGYNFYGHSTEHLSLCKNNNTNKVGIKGTQGDYCLKYNVIGGNFESFNSFQELNSTVSNYTISTVSQNIDNPSLAVTDPNFIGVTWDNTVNSGSTSNPAIIAAFNSSNPVLLQDSDLNLVSGRACPTATNKFFGYIGYTSLDWPEQKVTGQFGLAGEIEFNGLARNFRSSLNQWTIYLKGGLSY